MIGASARTTCFMLCVAFIHTGFAAHWNYKHEGEWPTLCKEGSKQSPIALSQKTAQREQFPSLIFENYDVTYPVQVKNNGHSIEIRLNGQNQATVKGGELPHVYVLDNLHFHWESEHVIEDVRFALELHLVHYANIYGNVSEALKHTGGVAVFGVLFFLSSDESESVRFEPLVAVIEKIQDKINTIEEMKIKLNDFLPKYREEYFRYNGSLTTPDCTEGLIWTVFKNKLPISNSHAKSFPLVKSNDNEQLVTNYRSLQKLNGRRVDFQYKPPRSAAAVNVNLECLTVVFLLMVTMRSI